MRNKELIIIAGPTGIGKTGLSIEIAGELGTEIISADSRQIYKEMSIGTAVPSKNQLSRVKHHFIQNISVKEYYNASIYENQVLNKLDELFQKYNQVVMTGGTGLYIDTVRFGIDELPEADMKLRQQLEERIQNHGLESLVKELKILDPVSYNSIDLKNPKRVQKAMEVSLMTGKPYSAFLNKGDRQRNFTTKLIALNMEREQLYERINLRTEAMMKAGWLEETERLLKYRDFNALNTVGYKELFAYLDGLMNLDEAVEKIKANTRKYARKQITWFRKEQGYRWFFPDEKDRILKYIYND